MPHNKSENSKPRMILHTAYVPAGNSPQTSTFWLQYNGIAFIGNSPQQSDQDLLRIEHDENGEPLRQRQKVG
jgi:hypothetical protein